MVVKNIKNNKKFAFTLSETLITIVILGIVASAAISNMKLQDTTDDIYKANGKNMATQIYIATVNIIAKHSREGTMNKLTDINGSNFNITDSTANAKLLNLYKKTLVSTRGTINNNFTNGSSYSSYFKVKNGTFFALALNRNCTATKSTYDPRTSNPATATSVTKTCGIIFYDVNCEKGPNTYGVDQYIIPIGKTGIK